MSDELVRLAEKARKFSEAEKEACWRGRGGVRSTGSRLSDFLDEVAVVLERAGRRRASLDTTQEAR